MKMERLGDICEFIIGQSWDSGKFSDTGIPIIRNINIGYEAYEFWAWDKEDRSRRKKPLTWLARKPEWDEYVYWEKAYDDEQLVFPNDLLFVMSVIPKIRQWRNGVSLLGKGIVKIKPYAGYNADYLYHILAYACRNAENRSIFSSLERLKNFRFHLPDSSLQKMVAAFLNKVQVLIFKRKETIGYLEMLQRSVFHNMFGDPMAKPVRYELQKLGDHINIKSTNIFRGKAGDLEEEEDVKILKLAAVKSNRFYPDQFTTLKKPNDVTKILHPVKGDLLMRRCIMTTDDTLACMVDYNYPDLVLPRDIWKIVPDKNLNKTFLCAVLQNKNVRNKIRSMAHGSIATLLYIPRLRFIELSIPVPPIQDQIRFEKQYQKIEIYKNKSEHTLWHMFNLQQTLCYLAFKGELILDITADFERLLGGGYDGFKDNCSPGILEVMLQYLDKMENNPRQFHESRLYDNAREFAFQLLKDDLLEQVYDTGSHSVKLKAK